jgi:hypothetical protein
MIFMTFISMHSVIICVVLPWRTYEMHPALSLKSGCDKLQLASLLGMRYKSCLSQNKHWLVLKCVLPLEAYEDSSFQHGQVGDATVSPY